MASASLAGIRMSCAPGRYFAMQRIVRPAAALRHQSGAARGYRHHHYLATATASAGPRSHHRRRDGDVLASIRPPPPSALDPRRFSHSATVSAASSPAHAARQSMDPSSLNPKLHGKPTAHRRAHQPEASSRAEGGEAGRGRISSHIAKQSSLTTRILFDTIAPHVEVRTLSQLTKQLSKIDFKGHVTRAERNVALVSALGKLFEGGDKSASGADGAASVEYTYGLKGHPWILQSLTEYFIGKKLDMPDERGSSPFPHEGEPTFPPNQNRRDYGENLDTLMRAREASLRNPIFWSEQNRRNAGYSSGGRGNRRDGKRMAEYERTLKAKHSRKSGAELRSEAEQVMELLMSRLPPPHFSKLMGKLRGFTRLDDEARGADAERKNDPNGWCIDDGDFTPLPELPQSRESHTDYKRYRIPTLGKFLAECSDSHSHFVAVDLGNYFYMEMPRSSAAAAPSAREGSEGGGGDAAAPAFGLDKSAVYAVQKQGQLHSSARKYSKARSAFVKKVMNVQHKFASQEGAADESAADAPSGGGGALGTASIDGMKPDEDDEDVSSDFLERDFERAQAPYSPDTRKKQQEELSETLLELRRMASSSNKKGRGRPKAGSHLRFSALRMDGAVPCTESESEERILFINNLPIDTTVQEIDSIYSRFGQLDSIQLFGLRPDLDPGQLSKKQLQERRLKESVRNSSYSAINETRKHRPRTPVYGLLRFQTAEGYKVACSPELTIFGCVIRRHPVLSIKHDVMRTLYLEQLSPDLDSVGLESRLATLLQPHNFHVMLDGMKGAGWDRSSGGANGDDYSMPSSCRIKFEDFTSAFRAYHWIREGGNDDEGEGNEDERGGNIVSVLGDECQLHWFRTPADSMDYWTRNIMP